MKSILILLFLNPVIAFAGNNTSILGEWYTADKKSKIKIYRCGNEICGKIAWLKDPEGADGQPLKDDNNPDKSLRDRPLLGLDILHGFTKSGDNKWTGGKIYDPKNGKTYKCKMTLEGDVLKVRGYVGISLFGRTEEWTRAE